MRIEISKRLKALPPYLFAEFDQLKREAKAEGRDFIDLGVGDPDQATPKHIIKALQQAAEEGSNHHYALDFGMDRLREAIANWYNVRFGVSLNPKTQILPLLGTKEGIAHLPVGFVNRGDVVLHTEPCYPPYRTGTILAGGEPHALSLLEENGFLPDLDSVSGRVRKKAKLLFINYPNNPTGATTDSAFFEKLRDWGLENNIIICHDFAYSEIAFDGYKPSSFLGIVGATEAGVEFHSLSKTYYMTGWRIGWVCGNEEVIKALSKVKSNIDSGIFQAIQLAGIVALQGPQDCVNSMVELYQDRRNTLIEGLKSLGWQVKSPKATFYIWTKIPSTEKSSKDFAMRILRELDIILTPGVGFGPAGEGYIRMALTVPKERLQKAVERLKKL